jgi:hypothetical protein
MPRRVGAFDMKLDNGHMDAANREQDLEIFCRQVRARSSELQEAMRLVAQRKLTSVMVGLLRQELDSMVRVMFLLAQRDRTLRTQLIEDSVHGRRWKVPTTAGKATLVTDKELVELGESFTGWARNVYRFGCSIIHLSNLHDHQARDPFQALSVEEREAISAQLNNYHGARLSTESDFAELVQWVPRVLGKISTNLELYLKQLEEDGDLVS